jgi:hypothetical protein
MLSRYTCTDRGTEVNALRRSASVLIFCLAALLAAATVHAGSIETLLMPGEVIQGHAKYETECKNCHARFSKKKQDDLCLDCHKEVGKDIHARQGYHGRIKNLQTRTCKSCHTEHRGRNANILNLDKEVFDHAQTDFALKGGHVAIKCSSCHVAGKKYREAPGECIDCHKKDDKHKGRLGEQCLDCHRVSSWRDSRYDHNKTRFPLKGKHVDADCNSCHINEKYKDTPTACYSCHKLNDEHYGRYGNKCQNCHAEKGWDKVTFDHDKDTRYRLTGKHRQAKCQTCHTGTLYEEKLGKQCYSCHKFDDEHNGRYGKKCDSCHATSGWKTVRFDHDRDTSFPLRGKHEQANCSKCHKGDPASEKLQTDCLGCHKRDDVHKGQEGKQCQRCHDENGWRQKVRFDHDLSRFPLIGLHALASCEECHQTATYKDTERSCDGCHRKQDVHKGGLGADCAQCHNPNGWRIWEFDHNTQTDYPLDGAHSSLACHACHREQAGQRIELATDCLSCHRRDDVHSGNFGSRCDRCHVTSSFFDIEIKK